MSDLCWVSCSVREFGPVVGRDRHLIRRGGLTTLCGHSASVPGIWRGNTSKDRCQTCVRLAKKEWT